LEVVKLTLERRSLSAAIDTASGDLLQQELLVLLLLTALLNDIALVRTLSLHHGTMQLIDLSLALTYLRSEEPM
jgi:hypothetical protein